MDNPMHVDCGVMNCKYNWKHSCHAEYLSVDAPAGVTHTSSGTACSTFIEE
ncbi:MAG: DUF1540 domain-containing protein [Peptococcaceae bacterium]|nr:DUF1540 domain-containing protein [Peptococcaceae bacterium]MDR2736935.1 DUF1540 domain-containing protein [Gracilibacteraceae bacterium]